MLTMSCNKPYFQGLLGAVRDTWAKPLIKNKYEMISWWSYTSCDNNHPNECIDFENHMIYVNCDDDLKSTYLKTKRAYELIKSTGINFDYVVRTNTSVYVNLNNMLDRIEKLDDDTVIANWFPFYMGEEFMFYSFVGFFVGMNRNFFDYAISSDDCYINGVKQNDDIVMSKNIFCNIPEINGLCADDDNRLVMYKSILSNDTETINEEEVKKYNFDFINDPNIINHRVVVRFRSWYDGDDRIAKGHEIEHIYELDNALKKINMY